MSKKVFLSPLAEFKIQMILAYLENEWNAQVKEAFFAKLKQTLNHIASYPNSCRKAEDFPGVYKCVVTKHNSLFYRVKTHEIEVITVIDNRQDPQQVWEEISRCF